MATWNYSQSGDILPLAAPYDVEVGDGALVGSLFGVAITNAASGDTGQFKTNGVFELAKTSAQAWSQGALIYWDNTNKRCDSDGTIGQLIGTATSAAANPSSTGYVRLNGTVPSTAEGPQAAIVSLTDSTGGSGTHDDTLADGLTVTAPAALTAVDLDNEIVASADAQQDVVALLLTDGTMTGTADGALELIGSTSGGDVSGAIMNNFKDVQAKLALAQANDATIAVQVDALTADVTALHGKVGTIVTDVTVLNQNVSDLGQKVNEVLTALRAAGIIAAS
jgi:predicted RecA/RadA family phage recombinase